MVVIFLVLIIFSQFAGANQTNDSDKYTFGNYGGEEFTPEPMEFGQNLADQEQGGVTISSTTPINETERKHVLLQFYVNASEDQIMSLEEYGIEIVGLAEDYTYIVSMPASLTPADLPAESGLRWMGEIPVENKYDSLNVPDWARKADGQVELDIRFYEDIAPQEAESIANKYSSSTPELLYPATSDHLIVYGIITEENNITSIASEDIVEIVYFPEPPFTSEDESVTDNRQSPGFQFIYGLLLLTIASFYLKRRGFNHE